MKLIGNVGINRIIDLIRPSLSPEHQMDLASRTFSLFAFGEILREIRTLRRSRLLLPPADSDLEMLGGKVDRQFRNRLQTRWLASQCADWIRDTADVKRAHGPVPQGILVLRGGNSDPQKVVLGSVSFSTEGLGITPGNPLSLIRHLRRLKRPSRSASGTMPSGRGFRRTTQ